MVVTFSDSEAMQDFERRLKDGPGHVAQISCREEAYRDFPLGIEIHPTI